MTSQIQIYKDLDPKSTEVHLGKYSREIICVLASTNGFVHVVSTYRDKKLGFLKFE